MSPTTSNGQRTQYEPKLCDEPGSWMPRVVTPQPGRCQTLDEQEQGESWEAQ
jgi:hypothetical protein